ncbi:MAG TPA: GHKL domain-containing protein [Desulfotomaculum sp.]|nr:MAG: hypothetical protein VR67_01880 [Peptococcaceae bacterium BRH_c8a]KJS75816.1 MAG: hypothetical protein JL56_06770 [Desulfotomaculum sp. BICA1-6]HBX24506.1 GHKL domain-containing protein [Desulfotomaculum sp.]
MSGSVFESGQMHRLAVIFLSVNLLMLIGTRALNYYNNQTNLMDLLLSSAIGINFFMALVFYSWLLRFQGFYTESQTQINSLRYMEEALDTMRGERHEFINHLRAMQGLIAEGKGQEATGYLKNVESSTLANGQLLNVNNPYLRSLLKNKKQALLGQGIELTISIKSNLDFFDLQPVAITTIFTNLLDNAAEAAKLANNEVNEVRFEVHEFENYYCFLVIDSGPPIPQETASRIFESGFSTKGDDRGYGLPLVRQALAECRGKVAYDPDTKTFNVIIPKQMPRID